MSSYYSCHGHYARCCIGRTATVSAYPSSSALYLRSGGSGSGNDRGSRSDVNYNDDDDDDGGDDNFDNLFERRLDERMQKYSKSKGDPRSRTRKSKEAVNAKADFSFLNGLNRWEVLNRAVVAGVFVAGIGTGITLDSAINTNPDNLASRDAIDRNAPNPKLCAAYGSSAMALDQRIFVTFNPFNVYVTQADTKPGCVLKPSNVVTLLQKERNLISEEEVQACKNGFNTWAYVGDINKKPQLTCVFQSDDAQNEFLSNPKIGIGQDVYDDDGDKDETPKDLPRK